MDSGQIFNILRFEQPQTIAFVLASLGDGQRGGSATDDGTKYSGTSC